MEHVSSTSLASIGILLSGCEFWVKRDDRTSALYGGNKVRKLELLIADARARGARRLVTLGAVGSHHVLATAIHGGAAGFEVHAVLAPQPPSSRVAMNVRAGLAHGLHAYPVRSYAAVPFALAPLVRMRDSYFVALGGSSVVGSMGYVDAARELAMQVRAGEMPEPDVIVVALGSGGTAAGLAAGLAREGMRTRVLGVCISEPTWLMTWVARWLARACLKRCGGDASRSAMAARLAVETRYVGAGYGVETEAGARALESAASLGLALDPTYTAKTFAAALDIARAQAGPTKTQVKTLLYWHTLSSAPMEPLLAGAPELDAIDARVRRLLP